MKAGTKIKTNKLTFLLLLIIFIISPLFLFDNYAYAANEGCIGCHPKNVNFSAGGKHSSVRQLCAVHVMKVKQPIC
jgi:hypothetical protein